ncbi:unnamed protein product [Umbelopsis ramanniana]
MQAVIHSDMDESANHDRSQRTMSGRIPQHAMSSSSLHHTRRPSARRRPSSSRQHSRQSSSSNLVTSGRQKLKRSQSSKHHTARQSEASSSFDSNDEETHSDDSKRYRPSTSRRHSKDDNTSNNENDEHDESIPEQEEENQDDESDREMTLKDRQDAMNKSHPFGLPIWKPALYKKSRSVVRRANSALHSAPTSTPELFLYPGNILWALVFGWWLALVMHILSLIVLVVPPDGHKYASVLRGLANYLFWPFGKYVQRLVDIEPESLSNYDNRQLSEDSQGDSDMDEDLGLISGRRHKRKNRLEAFKDNTKELFALGPGGWAFYFLFYTILAPLQLFVSAICWGCVITIPMAKLTYVLTRHLRKHPLSLRFKSSGSTLMPSSSSFNKRTVILLCTYQAIGLQYYKYTYDGINIIFINLLPVAFFVIFDENVLHERFPNAWFTSASFVFMLGLGSVIPLSYFIGMAVSSISAQSSMGLGAVINATFGSIIEIILYSVALMRGKSSLVEGSLIGSFLAGVLLMPGCSMLSGAVKRKEQKFNAKSAGVTSTMLIMAIIAALTPTLFYQMYGSFELRCSGCPESPQSDVFACSRCYYDQMNPAMDPVYQNSVKPLMWLCACVLPTAYFIALIFSLHTHADMVWSSSHAHHGNEESSYRKLLPTHIISQLVHLNHNQSQTDLRNGQVNSTVDPSTAFNLPYNTSHVAVVTTNPLRPGSFDDNRNDITAENLTENLAQNISSSVPPVTWVHAREPEEDEDEEAAGHDSPNWSKSKSFTILFGCTILYSLIAEILVDTVDTVMDSLAIDEKFLGLTLFALVPNITEFMNAISFALNGNIVLSLEIGSAYALQVCLIQIPAMVGFSLWYNWGMMDVSQYTFTLVFPRWDAICVIFSVFLLTYTYQEGKSNYFKGSILILSYFVLMAGFYLTPPSASHSVLDGSPTLMRS